MGRVLEEAAALRVPHQVSQHLGSRAKVRSVSDAGVELALRGPDRVVDVLFDGRRIWSFWLARDTEPGRGLRRFVAWPEPMRPFLDGRAQVRIADHVANEVLFDDAVSFGAGEKEIVFRNRAGLEISLDKSGKFSPTFSVRTERDVAPLLDGMTAVVDALAEIGITAFPAWGSLLGAVREQDLLGHDSDADLSYLSKATTPVDVVRESFVLQRLLTERGFSTYRYSGAAFRISIVEGDGATRGLDLFAAFFDHDRLYVMGEVGTDYREEWLVPFGTCTIAGREYPAPAEPDRMLAAMYGPGWRVPDPAFQFNTPDDVKARLNDWFRGTAAFRREWERELSRRTGVARTPSDLARLLHRQAPAEARVLEVGIGQGADALWLAGRGRTVVGYDFVGRAGRAAVRQAAKRDLDLTLRPLNVAELRSVLGEGARVVREPGPRVLLARHLLDATTGQGRQHFMRFASLALRGGGRLYAEVWTGDGPGDFGLRPVSLAAVVALVEGAGGRVVSAEQVEPDAGADASQRSVGRVIAEW